MTKPRRDRPTIAAQAKAAVAAMPSKYAAGTPWADYLNEEETHQRIIAYVRDTGHDPRTVLDEPWCCKHCGAYIPKAHRNFGFGYICEDCNSKCV